MRSRLARRPPTRQLEQSVDKIGHGFGRLQQLDIIQGRSLVKVWTPFTVTQALGYGSAARGGAPSTADGRLFAFGNTLESAIKTVLGLRQQGVDGQPPFDRTSGEGFVAAHDGDYADALRKRYSVVLFNAESTGAVGPRAIRLLWQLAKDTKRKGATDGTVYGTARTSIRSSFVRTLSAVAAAVMHADALALETAAASSAFVDTRAAIRAVVGAA